MIDSIQLESYQIPSFYHLLEDYGVNSVPPTSEFEVYRGSMNGSIISISINGQVSHVADRQLQEIVDIVFEDMSTPDSSSPSLSANQSTYMVLAQPSTPHRSPPKNHLNIWLTPTQSNYALDLLETNPDMERQKPEYQFETDRFVKNGHVIRFHKNGKIIAEEGYSTFAPILSEAIQQYLPYAEYDLIIGQDEVGIGEHIGPLVVGNVAATPQQLVDLQLVGIKDSKMVPRQITGPFVRWIREISTTTSNYQLNPTEYNQVKMEYQLSTVKMLTYAHNQAVVSMATQLKQLGVDYDNILYIVDEYDKYERLKSLPDVFGTEVSVKYLAHAEQKSISVAAASLRAKLDRNLWIQKQEKVHGIALKRKYINKLRQLSHSHQFLKVS